MADDKKKTDNPFVAVASALEGATADDIKKQLPELLELVGEHLLDQAKDLGEFDAEALSGHIAAVAKGLGLDNGPARDIVGLLLGLASNLEQSVARDAQAVADTIAKAAK